MGLLEGAISIGSQLLGINQQNRNIDKQNEANRQLAQFEFNKNLEMWNKGNEYNNPSSQMARLSKAGLNPNLVYGSGSVVGNTTSQLPKYNAPTANMNYAVPDVAKMLSTYQDFMVTQAKTDNLKAQNDILQSMKVIKGSEALASAGPVKYVDHGDGTMDVIKLPGIFETRRRLSETQSDVAEATKNAIINQAGLKVVNLEEAIKNIMSGTELKKSQNVGQDITNKFLSGSQLANILNKILPFLIKR